jgi:hypothetical protein
MDYLLVGYIYDNSNHDTTATQHPFRWLKRAQFRPNDVNGHHMVYIRTTHGAMRTRSSE